MKYDDKEMIKRDVLDVLLDDDNRESIFLTDSRGRQLEFEQVAVIPYKRKMYCILKPITKIEGVGDDEAIAFRVDAAPDGSSELNVETDEMTVIELFERYYDMIEEARKKKK